MEEASAEAERVLSPDPCSIAQPPTSPLFLPTVLEVVFRELSDRDLVTASHVCVTWRSEARRLMVGRRSFVIRSKDDMVQLIKLIDRNPSQLAARLHFQDCDLNGPVFGQLVNRVTSTLSTLSMDSCLIDSMEPIHTLLQKAKKLSNLTLHTLKRIVSPGPPEDIYFLHGLFPVLTTNGAPVVIDTVTQLEFTAYDTNFDAKCTDLAATIKTFPNLEQLVCRNAIIDNAEEYKDLTLSKLRRLAVVMMGPHSGEFGGRELNDKVVTAFQNLNLTSLHFLTLHNVSMSINPDVLRKFLESLPQLRHLFLQKIVVPFHGTIALLPMTLPSLKGLKVDRTYLRNVNHVMAHFPSLVTLDFAFEASDEDWRRILPKNVATNNTVRNLRFDWIDVKSFARMMGSFSGITRLTLMHANDDMLKIIFESNFPLKFLCCSDMQNKEKSRMTSLGVTGLSSQQPKSQQSRAAYIGNSQGLSFVHLCFSEPPNESILWEGLVHCKNLKHLSLVGLKLSGRTIRAFGRTTSLINITLPTEALRNSRLYSPDELRLPIYTFGHVTRLKSGVCPGESESEEEWSQRLASGF